VLSNSVGAIEGTGTVTVRTRLDGESVVISIRDTGVGMPAEVVQRLFEPFFTTKDVGEGTGLGMSISHGIIEGHEGRIEVDSQVGSGTHVQIYVPLKGPRG
jgi:two-component system, NtrC family, sensor kinase